MKKILSVLAWIVSIIFHPIGMVPLVCAIIYFCYSLPILEFLSVSQFCEVLLPVVALYYVLPLVVAGVYALFFIRKENVNESNHRSLLLSFVLIIYSVSLFNSAIPSYFYIYVVSCTVALFFAAIVTYFWKISLHAIGSGGLVGALVGACIIIPTPYVRVAVLQFIPFAVVLAGIIGTARLYLQAHTSLQVYAGYLLGFVGVLGSLMGIYFFL